VVDDAVALVAVLLWATTAIEAVHVARRRPSEPALRALLLTFAFLAVSATFFVPAIQNRAAQAVGVANINEPIARTALLGAAWSVQVLLLRLRDPVAARTRTRRRSIVLLATLLALWTLFAMASVPHQTRLFTAQYGSSPVVAAYLAVSLAYLAFALIDVIRGVTRYARSAPPPLATGLRLIGLGCLLGLGYVAGKASYLIALATHSNLVSSGLESSIDRSLAVGGGLLVTAGSTLPFLADRAGRARAWWLAYRNLRHLYPLWAALYAAAPGIALDPPSSPLADRLRLRDVRLRLYRRVIEIRDGRLALATQLDPDVIARERAQALAVGWSPVEADAAGEAAALLGAIRHQHRGPAGGTPPPSPDHSATLPDEVDWLLRVARHLHRLAAATIPSATGTSAATTPRMDP
jgi:hypothetical protein